MKKCITIIFLIVSSYAISQKMSRQVGDTLYYKGPKLVYEKSTSFAIYKGQDEEGIHLDFYLFDRIENTSNLVSKSITSSLEKIKKEGKEIRYHRNGNVSEEGLYLNGVRTGLWKFYFKKGTIKITREYTQKGKLTVNRIVDAWDFDGNKTVENGTGIFYQYSFDDDSYIQKGMLKDSKRIGKWEGIKEYGKYYTEYYKNGILKKGISWDKEGKKYKYKELNVKASYAGGQSALRSFLAKNLDISVPREGTDIGVRRRYHILFKIGKDGTISDVKIWGGTKESLYVDREIRRVFKLMKPWNPGEQRGQLIATRFMLPLIVQYTK